MRFGGARTYVPRIHSAPRPVPETPRLELDHRDYFCPDAEYLWQHVNKGNNTCHYCERHLFYDWNCDWYYAARHIIEENPYV